MIYRLPILSFISVALCKRLLWFGVSGLVFGFGLWGWWTPAQASELFNGYDYSDASYTGQNIFGATGAGDYTKKGWTWIAEASGTVTSTQLLFYQQYATMAGVCYMYVYDSPATPTSTLLGTATTTCPDIGTVGSRALVRFNFSAENGEQFDITAGHKYLFYMYATGLGASYPCFGTYTSAPLTPITYHAWKQATGAYFQGDHTVNAPLIVYGSDAPPPPPDEPAYTHFYNVWPSDGTVVTTTRVEISADYYMEALNIYDRVGFSVQEKSRTYQITSETYPGLEPGYGHVDIAFDLTASTSYAFWGVMLATPTSTGGFLDYTRHEFSVFAEPFPWITPQGINDLMLVSSTDELSYAECSISNLAGCFQNALMWAFYPDSDVWDQLAGVGDLVKLKPPLGYLSALSDGLTGMTATGTPAFELATSSPAMIYIFDPMRLGMTWVLWLLFAGYILRLVGGLHV